MRGSLGITTLPGGTLPLSVSLGLGLLYSLQRASSLFWVLLPKAQFEMSLSGFQAESSLDAAMMHLAFMQGAPVWKRTR